jgi:hypothetical protein
MTRKFAAEFIGTAWLVLGGCGSAVLAAAFPALGIGFVGVALAFGLTVLTMAHAIGHVSGCHLNPAVSVGLWAGGRFPAKDLPGYIIAQVAGGIAGAGILYLIASGHAGFDVHAGFASNGYGEHSPGGYGLTAALVCEIVMTFAFLFVILGSTHSRAPAGFAAHRHRPVPDLDPPDLHPGDQHQRQSGPLDGARFVRRRLGAGSAVAVLGSADRGRRDCRLCLSLAVRHAPAIIRPGKIGPSLAAA